MGFKITSEQMAAFKKAIGHKSVISIETGVDHFTAWEGVRIVVTVFPKGMEPVRAMQAVSLRNGIPADVVLHEMLHHLTHNILDSCMQEVSA